MKKLINNEGKVVRVRTFLYEQLEQSYKNGVWMVLVLDMDGKKHSVILTENFN